MVAEGSSTKLVVHELYIRVSVCSVSVAKSVLADIVNDHSAGGRYPRDATLTPRELEDSYCDRACLSHAVGAAYIVRSAGCLLPVTQDLQQGVQLFGLSPQFEFDSGPRAPCDCGVVYSR